MLIGLDLVTVRKNNSWLFWKGLCSGYDNMTGLLVWSWEPATLTCDQKFLSGKQGELLTFVIIANFAEECAANRVGE